MFVKFAQNGEMAIYECHKVIAKSLIDSQRKVTLLQFDNAVEIEVPKGTSVFIMNNDGKTIDKYK